MGAGQWWAQTAVNRSPRQAMEVRLLPPAPLAGRRARAELRPRTGSSMAERPPFKRLRGGSTPLRSSLGSITWTRRSTVEQPPLKRHQGGSTPPGSTTHRSRPIGRPAASDPANAGSNPASGAARDGCLRPALGLPSPSGWGKAPARPRRLLSSSRRGGEGRRQTRPSAAPPGATGGYGGAPAPSARLHEARGRGRRHPLRKGPAGL